MNETVTGTTTKERHVAAKVVALMRVNSEWIPNEINENDLQYEKHDGQMI
jgi:hypothetical protein